MPGSTPGVVLAEYDGAYIDPFHGSAFDSGPGAVDAPRMARAAAALARALAAMSLGGGDGDGKAGTKAEAYTRSLFSSTWAVSDTNYTLTPPDIPQYPQIPLKHRLDPLKQPLNAPPVLQKALTLSRNLDECNPLDEGRDEGGGGGGGGG